MGAFFGACFLLLFFKFSFTNSEVDKKIHDLVEISTHLDSIGSDKAKSKRSLKKEPYTSIVILGSGRTIAEMLIEKDVPSKEAHAISKTLSSHLNLRRLSASLKFTIVFKDIAEEERQVLQLSVLKDKKTRIEVVLDKGKYTSKALKKQFKQTSKSLRFSIKNGLYADGQKAGVPYSVMKQLVQIYSYSMDFQRDIHSGDKVDVSFQQTLDPDNDEVQDSQLMYANLGGNAKTKPIYAFSTDDSKDYAFYYADGQCVRKQFIMTPIEGGRVSSGYGMRMHPIRGYSMMHRGLDFAARQGTRTLAAAGGTVTRCSWYSGYGHCVEIRHGNGYSTLYGHLSGYAKGMHVGKSVKQGEVIGYVGSTGSATGPHLHWEVKKHGHQIDPRSEAKLHISSNRLTGQQYKKFLSQKKQIDADVSSVLSIHKS